MNNPVVWFEIYVQDMARAKAFYEAVLALQLTRLENPDLEMWAFPMQPEAYGAAGALVRMPGFASGDNSVLVYFSCADCAVEAGRVAAAGGGCTRPRCPSASTAISPWWWTPRATCSACIPCSEP